VPRPDRQIRIAAALIGVAGLAACALALLSDELGVGTGGAGSGFGWSQISLLFAGGFAVAVGALLLARPQIVSRWVNWDMLRRNFSDEPQAGERSTPAGRMTNVGPVTRRLLLAVMAIAIALNVMQLPDKLAGTTHYRAYRALYTYESDDPFEVAISHDDSVGSPVAPFYYLGQLFPGSVIVVPATGVDSWFEFEPAVVAFGETSSVWEAAYDPERFLKLADLEQYRVFTETVVPDEKYPTETSERRVSFYVKGVPDDTFVVLTPKGAPYRYGPIVFVDTSVLDAEGVPTPTLRGRIQ
jgi:hypothetical protein